jgi:hypothetical protein
MSSDNQYTALGPAVVGFQTDGANIDVGADVAGTKLGAKGRCDEGPGVVGESNTMGVSGTGGLRGIYGRGQNRFNQPENTTGVLAEGYQEASGVTGLNFSSDRRARLGHGAGVVGASNADSDRDPQNPDKQLGAGVVGLSLSTLPQLIDTAEPLPLPDLKRVPDGDGTGVWGASGRGTGVYGESNNGRGGVFKSATIAQLGLVPLVNPTPLLPAIGQFGDLYVVVTGEDPATGGTLTVSMYLCVAPGDTTPGNAAQWAPFQFGPAVAGG